MLAPMMPLQASGVDASTAEIDLRAVARDLWPRDTLAWWLGGAPPRPDVVAWPSTAAEVERVLAAARAEGRRVVTYGAGSGVAGGARGVAGAVVLDTKRLDRIGPLDPDRWTVDVEAGVLGEHLERWLAARGFTVGHSPSSISCSTVGGWAAARSAGQFSSKYGVFEDMVLAVDAVAPGIGALRVGEGGEAPPEWMDQLLGSEGRLAVITGVRLRVWPLPERRWLRGYRFTDLAGAVDAMRALLQAELWPAVLRLYDPVDTRIGGRTRPKKARRGPGVVERLRAAISALPGARERLLALPLSLPGLLNDLADGLASGCLLIVGFEGEGEVVDASAAAAEALLAGRAEDLGPGPGERWYASRHAVSYKLMPIFEGGGFADTMEVAAPWSRVVAVYDAVRAAVRPYALVMCHLSHAYPEGCSLYFSFAGRGDLNTYDRAWRAALDAATAAGATTTHHHGVGRLKRAWATAEAGPAIAGFEALRAQLDPEGLLSAGGPFGAPVAALPPPPPPEPVDGLVAVAVARPGGAEAELAWPWERLPAPPRWQRAPWQVGWTEVRGAVAGQPCALGRAPRSAAGPDLRGWLAGQDPDATATISTAAPGPRWMGIGRPPQPWAVAQALLRADLRPAVLTVVDGALRVGFRGPAAEAFGRIAAAQVPGGLAPAPYEAAPLPAGPLEPAALDDPAVVWVTPQGALRRAAP